MAGRGKGRAPGAGDEQEVKELTRSFRLMSNATRLRLLLTLARKEQSVTALCEILGVSQPAASHHLGLLRMTGLVHDRRDGKKVFYSLDRRAWEAIGKRFLALGGSE